MTTNATFDKVVHKNLIGKYDMYGKEILPKATFNLAVYLLDKEVYECKPTLGDILYIKPTELLELWEITLKKKRKEFLLG
jgi:hypothetical protein